MVRRPESGCGMRWDAGDYLRFGRERGRPFHELLARVEAEAPAYVVDLGCGPGNLTRTLAQRWPGAQVDGVDSSPEMVERARADGEHERLRFSLGDVREWTADRPVDVLVSNATLHWVPGHLELLPRLVGALAPGGWFALQVPGNFVEPSHTAIAELRESPRWRGRLAGVDPGQPRSEEPATYLDALVALGCSVDVWETTYLQVLEGPDAVVRWMTGTGLRPVLSALDQGEHEEFLADYRERIAPAYPERPYGTVLPYRRVFAVAQRAIAA
ncbi:MAG: trans-aconitate 2-methyltransferase [Actinomycetes bacterium]